MKEYETLRQEIIQRINHRFQFVAILGGVGGFVLFRTTHMSYWQASIVAIASIIAVNVWFLSGNSIAACSRRISEIENEVNTFAGQKLLQWETMRIQQSIFHKIHKKFWCNKGQ